MGGGKASLNPPAVERAATLCFVNQSIQLVIFGRPGLHCCLRSCSSGSDGSCPLPRRAGRSLLVTLAFLPQSPSLGCGELSSCHRTAPRRSSGLGLLRLRCSVACGIFPDQGSNPCLLHWQMDCLPPILQGSPQTECFNDKAPDFTPGRLILPSSLTCGHLSLW